MILIAAGTLLTYWGTDLKNKKTTQKLQNSINSKSKQITELIEGKDQLLEKISNYEKALDNEKSKVKELEQITNIIQSLELHVFVNIKTPESQITDKETSAGLSSVIALFARDKTRYRLITDFQFTVQQIAPTIKTIGFIYRPENPLQILGKQLDFLKNIDNFVCNYQNFLKTVKIDDNLGGTIDINVFVNGVDVIALRDLSLNAGVLSGGQAMLDINESFAKIPERYIVKIKEKKVEN